MPLARVVMMSEAGRSKASSKACTKAASKRQAKAAPKQASKKRKEYVEKCDGSKRMKIDTTGSLCSCDLCGLSSEDLGTGQGFGTQ